MVDPAESGLSKKLDLKAGFRWMLLLTCILMWFYVAFYGMRWEGGLLLFFRLSLIKEDKQQYFHRTWSKWANYFFF